jgi:glutamine synthetase
MPTPKNVSDLIAQHNIQIIDLKFTDLPGTWQHFSIPTSELDGGIWEDGTGFDGSSIRGFQQIQ